jgi:hypothetical protein
MIHQKKFLVLCEGIQSRSKIAEENEFVSTIANIGIFNTREEAEKAIDKMKSYLREQDFISITLCKILSVENILYENLME